MSHRLRRSLGFSYVEVMVATFVLALALVPAVSALQTGMLAAAIHQGEATRRTALAAKLEEVVVRPFAELDAAAVAAGGGPTAYSDPVGASDRRRVWIDRWDAAEAELGNDPITSADTGLLQVRVEIEGSTLQIATLTAR